MPDEEPEEGFTFRDRRHSHVEEPRPTAEQASQEAFTVRDRRASEAAPPLPPPRPVDPRDTDDPGLPGMEEDASIPDIYSVLVLFLGELRNLAWLRMGLVANPATGKPEKDLTQARVAIDTVEFLAGQLAPVVAPEERLPLKAMVSDLQNRFIEQSRRP